MLANLKKNDEVITGGGIFGRVVELKDKIVTVEIAPGVRVRVSRPQISEVLSAPAAEKSSGSGKEKTKNTPD
jgi:preprotein translocase subunit YajC